MGGYAPLFNTPTKLHPARRPRGRPEHAAALLRAPRHLPAAASRPSSWQSTSGASGRTAWHQLVRSAHDSVRSIGARLHRPPSAPRHDRRAESAVVLPVDPTRRTEIDKQRVPMSARPYRLLALVKQDAVVRVQKEPDDTVMTWPHLLSIEFLAAGVMSIFLLMMGLFINAPARGAGQRQRDPGRGQGAVVLPRPAGAAGLLPPDRGRRARADVRAGRRRADPVHRSREHPGRRDRPSGRPRSCCSRCSAASD